MRRPLYLPLLAILVFGSAIAWSKDAAPSILPDLFKSTLDPRQVEALGKKPSLEQLADAMTPEQKTGVKKDLAEMERKTDDPKVLAQIAKGYDLLKEPEDMARVGERMQKLDPKGSQGYSVSATAFAQMNDYGPAVGNAHEALKRNPKDASAVAIIKLYENRGAAPKVDLKPVQNPFTADKSVGGLAPSQARAAGPGASPPASQDAANLPIKPVVPGKFTKIDPIPTIGPSQVKTNGADSSPAPSPLLPMAGVGVGLTAYGVYKSKETSTSEEGLNPDKKGEPTPGAVWTNRAIIAGIGATLIVAGGYAIAPYLPALSASGPATGMMVPALAGEGTMMGGEALALGRTTAGVIAAPLAYAAGRGGTISLANSQSGGGGGDDGINRKDLTAREIISKQKKGSINQEFPGEYYEKTLTEIEKSARSGDRQARKALKLLNDKRFDKAP